MQTSAPDSPLFLSSLANIQPSSPSHEGSSCQFVLPELVDLLAEIGVTSVIPLPVDLSVDLPVNLPVDMVVEGGEPALNEASGLSNVQKILIHNNFQLSLNIRGSFLGKHRNVVKFHTDFCNIVVANFPVALFDTIKDQLRQHAIILWRNCNTMQKRLNHANNTTPKNQLTLLPEWLLPVEADGLTFGPETAPLVQCAYFLSFKNVQSIVIDPQGYTNAVNSDGLWYFDPNKLPPAQKFILEELKKVCAPNCTLSFIS